MSQDTIIIWIAGGAALLVLLAMLLLVLMRTSAKRQAGEAVERVRGELQAEIQRLSLERDEAMRRTSELTAERAERDARLEEKEKEIQGEIARRSGAEASLEQIPGLRREKEELERQLEAARAELSALRAEMSGLRAMMEEGRKAAQEKLALLEQAKVDLSDAFKALSSDALSRNNASFLQLAKETLEKHQEGAKGDLDKRSQAIVELVKPIRDSLEKVDVKIQDLEKARITAYQEIKGQIQSLTATEKELRQETGNLVKALRAPQVRGRWGEMQLRRVVEIAGMVNRCDFEEQPTVDTDAGRQRPDMVIRLPAGRSIVVDSKVPMQSFIEAVQATNEEQRQRHLKDHARQLRDRVRELTAKKYWDQFEQTPEFVVLFLPGESFFSAALEQDASLLDEAGRFVILATPTTLIGLLRAVAYGWREEALATNAREISALGGQLYERLTKMGDHVGRVGKHLGQTVNAYNEAVGSLETRVMVSARKFKELGAAPSGAEIAEITPVDIATRELQTEELRALPAPATGVDD